MVDIVNRHLAIIGLVDAQGLPFLPISRQRLQRPNFTTSHDGFHHGFSYRRTALFSIYSTSKPDRLTRDCGKTSSWTTPARIGTPWDNRVWPCTYLIDKKGHVRFRWDGELKFNGLNGEEILRKKIKLLLEEKE
jgi:hypothetical protein